MLDLVILIHNITHTCCIISKKFNNHGKVKLAESILPHSGIASSKRFMNLPLYVLYILILLRSQRMLVLRRKY